MTCSGNLAVKSITFKAT